MRPCELLIVAALRMEGEALANAFNLPHAFPLIYTPSISLALVGPRATQLAALTSNLQPRAILLAGLAGALAPRLRVGDIVVSTNDRLIHTSDSVVATRAAKAALFKKTGAEAVDMETATVQAFAAARGVPCCVIRAISDTAQEELDPSVMGLVDPDGNPRVGKAVGMILRHPSRLTMLLRLNRASKIALSKLTAAVIAHVRAERRPATHDA